MSKTTDDSKPDELLGKTLAGRYLVTALIDRGGMGKVYRAEQQPLGRGVALKTLDLLDPRGEFKERFFNEASVASRLKHPNTVRIFDYGRSDEGVYFLTMELLEGQSLHALIKQAAPLRADRVIAITRQVCGALDEAHEMGIVHRDLKPGNVYLTAHGDEKDFVKVLDFGLVKNLESDVSLSQTGQALGSPLYMSPEQVEGDRVDRRSDIYSLGLVMYVALCGRVPFKKGSVATIMMQQVTGTIPPFSEIAPDVEIPASMEWIVRACIEKDRSKRIASMRQLSTALKVCQRELRGEFSEPVPWALDAAGNLAIPDSFLETHDDSHIRAVPLELNDVPSSPTLNRSNITTGAVVVGGAGIGLSLLAILVGVILLLVVAMLGVWFMVLAPQPTRPVTIEPALPVPAVIEPSAPAEKKVELLTDPPGAEVSRDSVLLGSTPLVLKITPGTATTFQLALPGYKDREVTLDGTVASIEVKLERGRRLPPVNTPIPTPPPGPVPAPTTAPAPKLAPSREQPMEIKSDDLRNPWD